MNEYISGYRPGTEGTPTKVYDIRHLLLSPEATKAQSNLYQAVWDHGDEVPCVQNPEPYTSDDLPTDREAQMMCGSCPVAVKTKCAIFAEIARPAHGVFAGQVHGRALAEAMKDEEEQND